jgi:hypothetical protein
MFIWLRLRSAGIVAAFVLAAAATVSGWAQIDFTHPWDPAAPLPQFITHDFVDPQYLNAIARYRSGVGHSFSDGYEPADRSLKNYFEPKPIYLNTRDALPLFAPATGALATVVPEGHVLANGERRGFQLSLIPDGYPAFEIRLFHVNLSAGLGAGSHVVAGDTLGFADLREAVDFDWAVAVAWNARPLFGDAGQALVAPGYRLLSPFDLMTDAAFAHYAAYNGITDRSQFVVPLAYRAAHPGRFIGQDLSNLDPIEYMLLQPTPAITVQPASQSGPAGQPLTLGVGASAGTAALTYVWSFNGYPQAGTNAATLVLPNLQPATAGLYAAIVTTAMSTVSEYAVVGVATNAKVIGNGREVASNIFVPANGHTFDQVLLEGVAATITADPGEITRLSFVDLTDDIVQVEFSGPGTLSLTLTDYIGPAFAANYNQPAVSYMKGHARIVITGATEDTNVAVFSVGRITAANPDLFRSDVGYDGMADIAFIAIASSNGKFGGVRTANARYSSYYGLSGVFAPGVQFTGPVYIGNIYATNPATPVIVIGSSPDTRIAGGDLLQSVGHAVQVAGITQLKFTAGVDSHGRPSPAKANRAVLILRSDGSDVTNAIVVNPPP